MFRILSLDGGGIRGVFPATILADFEQRAGNPIGQYFDLIAGTSTGGIIALALGLGIPAADIARLYSERGPAIFDQNHSSTQNSVKQFFRSLKRLTFGPKYSNLALKEAIAETLGEHRLGHSKARLLIPAFNPETQCVYVYKTAHHARFQTDYQVSAVDVAMATSAAPTYLEPYLSESSVELIDGGVWANNPIGAATVEAIGVLGWPADQLKILSIGTLTELSPPRHKSGAIRMVTSSYITDLFMAGLSDSAIGTAKILTGDSCSRKAIWRIDQPFPQGRFSLDKTSRIPEMQSRARYEARNQWPILQPHFFDGFAEPFQPLYPAP